MIDFSKIEEASFVLKTLSSDKKNEAIIYTSNQILEHSKEIIEENKKDVEEQIKKGKPTSFIDRLTLTEERIKLIASDMLKVASLDDPINNILEQWTAESGIQITKISCPIGVVGVVYEARPNVTVDVFTLLIKTGNACVLKGGSDAENSNKKIVEIIKKSLKKCGLPEDIIMLLPSDRSFVETLITSRDFIDLVIPRGSKGLIEFVVNNATVPVIETGAGVCHTFVSKFASIDEALKILENAKTSRPSVCNACETLLIEKTIAKEFLNKLSNRLPNVILRGEKFEQALCPSIKDLTDKNYFAEYGDLELSVKIVNNVEEAVNHINKYGTHHSDCICSQNLDEIEYFFNNVDSACVYSNASTRFSDGGCFGFGAEIGISTQKMHARGPMGLKALTTYKYKIMGKGEIR